MGKYGTFLEKTPEVFHTMHHLQGASKIRLVVGGRFVNSKISSLFFSSKTFSLVYYRHFLSDSGWFVTIPPLGHNDVRDANEV